MTERLSIDRLAEAIFTNAFEHGFYENQLSIPGRILKHDLVPEKIVLIHSEISEALEAYRDDAMALTTNEKGKPEGFPSEIVDVIIRSFDLLHARGYNIPVVFGHKGTLGTMALTGYADSRQLLRAAIPAMLAGLHKTATRVLIAWEAGDGPATGLELRALIEACVAMLRTEGHDPDVLVAQKMAYNASRPYKHGRARL